VGAALLATLGPVAVRAADIVPSGSGFHPGSLAMVTLALMFGAIGEEMLFRGYGFQVLVGAIGPFATVLPVSILFGFAHAGNPSAAPLALVNTIAWGIVLGAAFLRSGDLWLPIGLHYGWNWTLPLFGANLSGFKIDVTGYVLSWRAGPLWGGGDYGPEGGLIASVALIPPGVFSLSSPGAQAAGAPVAWPGGVLMRRRYFAVLLLAPLLKAEDEKLTFEERVEIVRGLTAEYATAKVLLPRSKKTLELDTAGKWDKAKWDAAFKEHGPAARVGDMIQVTKVNIGDDNLEFEINSGFKGGRKWWQNLEVGTGSHTRPISTNQSMAPGGTTLRLNFGKRLTALSAAEIKKLLAPVMDFERRSATEQYVDTLPEPVKEAIKEKRAIEGMDREQVLIALGRPRNKVRETKDGEDYEDWIYGTPPGKVSFVTFKEGKVVSVKDTYAGLGGSVAAPLPPR
jgi:hypothetical protein